MTFQNMTMKKLLLPGLAAALVLAFGCATPGTHDTITSQDKTVQPDINTNAAPSGLITTTNLNPTTITDMPTPK